MEKQVGLTEARDRFSEIINEVYYQGDTYVISKQGKPAIAMVPLSVLQQWREYRVAMFNVIDEVQAQNKEADPDEVMQAVIEAQEAVRLDMAQENMQNQA